MVVIYFICASVASWKGSRQKSFEPWSNASLPEKIRLIWKEAQQTWRRMQISNYQVM